MEATKTTILISKNALKVMQNDAEARFPNECCGCFFGKEGKVRAVTDVMVVNNSKEGDQRRRFEISAQDYLKAELYATRNSLDFLGIYHSHPNHPARPSEHDRKQATPVFSYIIISVMNGKSQDITSWLLNNELNFEEEEITIKD